MASKRNHRRKACIGKVRHDDERDARFAAVKMRKKKGECISYYRCGFCNGWHIGHRNGAAQKAL